MATKGVLTGQPENSSIEGIDSRTTIDGAPKADLPGTEAVYENKINWLGSSYSGADIKVVAHLYGEVDSTKEQSNLEADLKYFSQLRDGYNSLSAGDLLQFDKAEDNNSLRDALSSLAEEALDPRVFADITNFILSFRVYPLDVRYKKFSGAIDAQVDFFSRQIEEIQNRITKLDDIRKIASTTLTLATLQTLSVQSYREKVPVRALGHANVKGFVRGPRSVAGSMIFTMFNEHALAQLIRAMGSNKNRYGEMTTADDELSTLLGDQLPPLDLTIVFANEYGALSRGAIYGVEFMSSGITLSVEDLLTEEVVNFVARDLDPITSQGHISLQRDQRGMYFNDQGIKDDTSASKLLFTSRDSYYAYLEKLKVRRKLRNR